MSELSLTIVLPSGGARVAEIPDDVPVGELMAELTSLLKLPTVGPDGRPMGYRLDSKALGRELSEGETLAEAGVPAERPLDADRRYHCRGTWAWIKIHAFAA